MKLVKVGAGFASAAALVAIITLLSRVVGFGRWLVFAPTVGSEGVGTAYQSANLVPNILFEVAVGGALAGAIVPLLAGPISRGARHETSRIASALLTWAITILFPASILLALLSRPLAELIVSSGDSAQQAAGTVDLAGRLLLVFSPQLLLYGIGAVLTGVLQAHRKFLWPAFVPLLSSLVVIGAYLGYGAVTDGSIPQPADVSAGAEALLAWGTTAGVVAISLPLLLPTRSTGVRLRPTWRFPDGVARRAISLAGAGIVALLAQQAAAVVMLTFANRHGGESVLPVFNYTQAVYLLPYAVLIVPLATVAFPRLSELAGAGNKAEFAEHAARTTRVVVATNALSISALIAAAIPVGQFFANLRTEGSTEPSEVLLSMGSAVALMAVGLWGWGLVAHLSRALYALERGRQAATATGIGWAVAAAGYIGFGVLFARLLPGDRGSATLFGLAAGNSLGMLVAGVLLLIALRRCAGKDAVRDLPRTIIVSTAGSVVAAAAGWFAAAWLLRVAEPIGPVSSALVAGIFAALLAIAIVVAVVVLADRSTIAAAKALR
ncbi:lipid II flippase MurJ [Saxibacter everestensis]|uniref:Lipid II flippase MurJ n=1 Tax=Saxibacter everestensis TaxID=2909229 RepID=A0ABY8QVY8_9MICO|nr:lipid II flippase MurJ [Brevibacteriaceae bacterium ZFBP1038]